ncbi:LysR family transcriptional regulator [Plantactinospora endophytica]|uniref:LysR family transcriptional regulator n=1 Tax=Plantactinospora endophytica TaxID=673535 RepID=A0ABQ4EER7_9ACTN|nr:LysR family transcriptional regulator [Plantactinospora endophytica]GIG93194.1 LysR family transcriptional regulator [Plantactinospora endophytica]
MDPHLLRTFVVVADHRSFSAAARQLGYTQSAVSQHIAALESDLGVPLLHRRPVAPTEAGERLLEHAGPILLRLDAARLDVRQTATPPAGRLGVGATPLAATGRLAGALAAVRRAWPGLDVTVRVDGRQAVAAGFGTGEYALALVDGVVAPSDPLRLLDTGTPGGVPVAEQPLAVLLPERHPLARRAGFSLDDLLDAGWIDADDVAAPLPELRAAARSDGPRASIRYDGTDLAALVALVAAGHGLVVLPASAVPTGADVTLVPLTAPRLVHRTELLRPRNGGSVVDALADAIVGQTG